MLTQFIRYELECHACHRKTFVEWAVPLGAGFEEGAALPCPVMSEGWGVTENHHGLSATCPDCPQPGGRYYGGVMDLRQRNKWLAKALNE